MIIEGAYFREITMQEPTAKEFIRRFGEAVDMLPHAVEKNYDAMNMDQFLDWATDLMWIEDKHLIFIVRGAISDDVRELMNDIINFWRDEAEHVIVGGESKKVDFILVNK